MAIYREDFVDVELESGSIFRSFLSHSIGEGDKNANRFGVRVLKHGEPVQLTSVTCTGYFIRNDGQTVVITGFAADNIAYVDLPEACYAVEGQFSLAIKLSGGTVTGTMRIVDGVVANTTTGEVVDPGTLIPSIEDLIDAIDAAVAAIPQDYTDIQDGVAGLKKFPASEDVDVLADNSGTYVKTDGTEGTNSTLRCSDYIELPVGVTSVLMYPYSGTYKIVPAFCVYDESKTLLDYESPGSDDYTATGFSANLNLKKYRTAKYIRFNLSAKEEDSELTYFRFISENSIVHKPLGALIIEDDDVNNIRPNTVIGTYARRPDASNLPYDGWMGNMISLYGGIGNNDSTGMGVLAVSHDHRVHVRDCWGANKVWSAWQELAPDYAKREIFSGTFEEAQQRIVTGILLEPNTSYKIHCGSDLTGRINIFGNQNTQNYTSINPDKHDAIFKNDGSSRYLALYNVDGTLDTVSIEVRKLRYQGQINPTYYVSLTDPMADFDSITDCFLALKYDSEEKTIIIDGGDYDIYQEYVDAEIPVYTGDNPSMEYYDYCVWVPKNTHVVGNGIVRMKWMPTASQVTEPQSKTVSPLNVDDSCTIENIEVHCKNGRYCLHNDALNKSGKAGATEKYIRCRFYKYPNDTGLGFAHTIGFGLNRQRRCEYIGCEFYNTASGRAFYGHTWGVVGSVTLTEAMSGDITVTDCIIDTDGTYSVYLANATSDYLHIRVLFASCYISKKIAVTSGGSEERRNAFDLTLLNSGNPVIEYSNVTNPYEPSVYPPAE